MEQRRPLAGGVANRMAKMNHQYQTQSLGPMSNGSIIGSNTSQPGRRYNYKEILEPHGLDMYNQNQLK
jgi:hypothetical protein